MSYKFEREPWRKIEPGRWERYSYWNGALVAQRINGGAWRCWLATPDGRRLGYTRGLKSETAAKRAATRWLKRRIDETAFRAEKP